MAGMRTGRLLEPEVMDDPTLDAASHRRALAGLARINAVSRACASLWPPIRAALRRAERPMRLLDVACGGGDVTLGLRRRALRGGWPLTVHGCDISDTALELARERAAARHLAVEFYRCDVIGGELPGGYDIVTCNLFLHHLTCDAAVELLRRMRQGAGLVVVNDLRRSHWGLLATQVGVRVLSRSPVVHVDGPRSIRAAFSLGELSELVREAGLCGAEVRRCFPGRMLLIWRRS